MKYLIKIYNLLFKLNNNGIKLILPKYFTGYLLSGITAVLSLFITQYFLIQHIRMDFVFSQIFSTIIAMMISFNLNNKFTFKNRKTKTRNKFLKYLLINILSMIINVLIANMVYQYIYIWYISSLCGVCVAVIINFSFYKFKIWT